MCTRILWSSEGAPGEGIVLVARNMDWFEDTETDLWAMPRGVERTGMTSGATLNWTAKYGSVVALMYGLVAVDGLNEAGLTASGLYLAEADFGERNDARPGISLAVCMQYFLDNFATVGEATAWLAESNVQIVPMPLGSTGRPGAAHLSLADASGDSAIIQYLGGKLHLYHGPEHQIMANSPTYEEQLELRTHYVGLGGEMPLPGSTDSPDRFVRASYYAPRLPATSDERVAVAEVMSVARNVSAPFGTADPARPNISTTRWRSVADLTNLVYFFESTISPGIIWTHLRSLELGDGAKPRKLDLSGGPDLIGDVSADYVMAALPEMPVEA
jgi:penicillin V acylase-like amidase (Ntn superfamily)